MEGNKVEKKSKSLILSGGFRKRLRCIVESSILTDPTSSSPSDMLPSCSNAAIAESPVNVTEASMLEVENSTVSCDAPSVCDNSIIAETSAVCAAPSVKTSTCDACPAVFDVKAFQSELASWAVNSNINHDQLNSLGYGIRMCHCQIYRKIPELCFRHQEPFP